MAIVLGRVPKASTAGFAARYGWALASNGANPPLWVIKAGAPAGVPPTLFATDAEAYANAVGLVDVSTVAAEAVALHGTPYTGSN